MFTKETKFTGDYSDLEAIIKEVYGVEYEIMPMEEVGSSQYAAVMEIGVSKGALEDYELEELQTLKSGKPSQFILNTITQDLCNNNKLEEGQYLISVSW